MPTYRMIATTFIKVRPKSENEKHVDDRDWRDADRYMGNQSRLVAQESSYLASDSSSETMSEFGDENNQDYEYKSDGESDTTVSSIDDGYDSSPTRPPLQSEAKDIAPTLNRPQNKVHLRPITQAPHLKIASLDIPDEAFSEEHQACPRSLLKALLDIEAIGENPKITEVVLTLTQQLIPKNAVEI